MTRRSYRHSILDGARWRLRRASQTPPAILLHLEADHGGDEAAEAQRTELIGMIELRWWMRGMTVKAIDF